MKREKSGEFSNGVSQLARLQRFGIKLGLERIKEMAAFLGHPEKGLKIIHVAGTNGKGSAAAMVAYILEAAGFRVGLFTSPHLADWQERLAILKGKGLSFISKKEFAEGIEKARPVISKLKREKNGPTVFEALTALAFDYFAAKKVDFAVMEVGLGGRLDATNIGNPLVSVITNVSLEHTEYLGKTKERIAKEKAGIIKGGGVVISTEKDPKILEIIKGRCKRKKVKFIKVGKDIKILSFRIIQPKGKSPKSWGGVITVKGLKGIYSNLKLSLGGEYQAENAAIAIGAVESLSFFGIEIHRQAIRRGLESVYWPGRLELISTRPMVLLDGAHNPSAAVAVAKTLKKLRGYKESFLIFGCLKDKDADGILKAFLPLVNRVVITQPQNSRALAAKIISQNLNKYGRSGVVKGRVKEALKYALNQAKIKDLILITGSLYLAGEVARAFRQQKETGKKN